MLKPKILVTASHAGSVSSLLPVVRQLDLEGRVETVVIAKDAAEYNKSFEGVANYRPFSSYGNSISVEQVIEQERPVLVLTGTASPTNQYPSPIERTSVLAARKYNVKSAGVLDQWSEYDTRFRNNDGQPEFFPDVLAVIDSIAVEDIVAKGYDKDKLRITGNPYFDANADLAKEKPKLRKEVRSVISVPESATLVTYIGDKKSFFESYLPVGAKIPGTGYNDLDCVKLVCEGIARTADSVKKDVILLLRMHPQDPDLASWQNVVYEAASRVPVRTANDYKNSKLVCLASDLVISPASGLMNDSTMMGIDCISVQPHPINAQEILLTKMDIIPNTFDSEEGSELVRKVLTEGLPDKYRQRRDSFKVLPGATGRVKDLVYELVDLK